MPTLKTRICITPDSNLLSVIKFLAERDNISVSKKAIDLLKHSIELEEDDVLNSISTSRDNENADFISHNNAW